MHSALIAAVLVASALEDSPAPDARKILTALEARAGDAAARAAVKTFRGAGTVTAAGMSGAGSFTEVHVAPDQVRFDTSWKGFGGSSQGVAAAFAWSTDPVLGVTIAENEERGAFARTFATARRAPWTALYSDARVAGRSVVGDRACYQVELTPAAGAAETWHVDCETSDLLRLDTVLPNPGGGKLPMSWLYSDYRDVSGVRVAYVRTQLAGQYQLVYTYEDIALNAAVAEADVAPPAEATAAYGNPAARGIRMPDRGGECAIEELAPRQALTIRATVKTSEISKNLAIMLPEVGAYVHQAGAETVGPPFSRYHAITPETIDLEAGIMVKERVEGSGRVQASELPGGRAAVTWHVGPYHELMKTHAILEAWIKEQQLAPRAPVWEVYWTDPGIEQNPAKWKTQILWPVE